MRPTMWIRASMKRSEEEERDVEEKKKTRKRG
jgi:hypothetical protein